MKKKLIRTGKNEGEYWDLVAAQEAEERKEKKREKLYEVTLTTPRKKHTIRLKATNDMGAYEWATSGFPHRILSVDIKRVKSSKKP